MAQKKDNWFRKLWDNFVFRNIILALSSLIIIVFVVSILLKVFTRHNKYKDVPEFVGVTLDEARKLARKDKLRIEINDSLYVPSFDPGVILEQKPDAGTKVKSKRRIFVTVNSFSQKMVDVPYITGYSLRQAKNIIETAGLEIERLTYVSDIATNNVLEQRVNGVLITADSDMQAEMGSGVILTVGKAPGAARVAIPRVVGLPYSTAKSRILESGLNMGKVTTDKDVDNYTGRDVKVYRQSPEQYELVELGREINIFLSADSLTVASGVSKANRTNESTNRTRIVADSLRNRGYEGEELNAELDWIIRRERGELTEEEIRRRERRIDQRTEREENDDDDFFW